MTTGDQWGLAKNGKAVHLIDPGTGRAQCPDTRHPGNHYKIMKIFPPGEWHPEYPMTCTVCKKYHEAEQVIRVATGTGEA